MKVGDVITYVAGDGVIREAKVLSVVCTVKNKRGEHCTTMWVQRLRKTRTKKPVPMTIAVYGTRRRVVGHGPVVSIS